MALPFPTSSPPTRAGALRRPLPRSSTDMPARTKSKETRVSFPTTPDLDDGEGSPPRQREPSAASLPRLLARSRRVSLPANLVQTHSHSLAGTGGSYFGASPYSADNRMSVASFASMSSFDSLPEEDEEATTPDAGERRDAPPTARPPLLRRSVSPSRPSPLPRPVSFAPQGSARSNNPKRNSLPTPPAFDGSYRPFSLGPMPLSRSSSRGRTSPLGRDDRDEELGEKGKRSEGEREQERAKREERRWKIAEELRETERAYVDVLEEIDAVSIASHSWS